MFQANLFEHEPAAAPVPRARPAALDLPALLERIAKVSVRPRYAFMVLNLIAQASGGTGRAGPHVRVGKALVPIRDWLCDALAPMAQREPKRVALRATVLQELARDGRLPADAAQAEKLAEAEVRDRMRLSARTNVSHAVSELVKAGLLKRYYQGYRVDHENRGAQRQAVYLLTEEARAALSPAVDPSSVKVGTHLPKLRPHGRPPSL